MSCITRYGLYRNGWQFVVWTRVKSAKIPPVKHNANTNTQQWLYSERSTALIRWMSLSGAADCCNIKSMMMMMVMMIRWTANYRQTAEHLSSAVQVTTLHPADSLLNICVIRCNSASTTALYSFNSAVESTAILLLPRGLYSSTIYSYKSHYLSLSDVVYSSPH